MIITKNRTVFPWEMKQNVYVRGGAAGKSLMDIVEKLVVSWEYGTC